MMQLLAGNGLTPASRVRRGAGTLAVASALLLSASCTSGSDTSADDSTVPPTGQVSTSATDDVDRRSDNADTDTDITATTTGTATTLPSPSSTTTSMPASTVAPTTTNALADAYLDETCGVLQTEGYDTRKKAFAALAETYAELDGVGDGLDALSGRCIEAVTRLDAAMAVEARGAALEGDFEKSLTATDFTCVSGVAELQLTNVTDHPVGARITVAFTTDGTGPAFATNSEPIVVWSIEPGATVQVEGSTVVDGGDFNCGIDIDLFDATPSEADASLGTAQLTELTGDDPAIWLPALLEYEIAGDGTGERDRAAVTEDVRSTSYDGVINSIRFDQRSGPFDFPEVAVCDLGRSSPDPDLMSLVFSVDYPTSEPFLSHGIFRRGSDGQWRWLSASSVFISAAYNSCL